MFEKLLAILPYNPGLADQMAFYARRMHEESIIRRTGLAFIILTFFIQFFAVLNPPQPAGAATSYNDMLSNGFSSRAEAKNKCNDNQRHFKTIAHYYNITCASLGTAEVISKLPSNAWGGKLYSMGHRPYGIAGETNAHVPGLDNDGPVYWRLLDGWGRSNYRALKIKNAQGHVFYVLFDCGNLVSVGLPKVETIAYTHPTTPITPTTPTWVYKPLPVPPPTPKPTPTPKCPYNATLPPTSPLCFPPCPYNPTVATTNALCKPCEKGVDAQDVFACLNISKAASNPTQGLADANASTAQASDDIIYTLYVRNDGKTDVKDFTFAESMSDVLDYADITDLHGGVMSADQIVSWPAEVITAGATVSHQVSIKVKNPIPETPIGTSDPNHFDSVMTNVYGNAVNINVPGTPAKEVETVAAVLPNTGPGSSLLIAGTVVLLAGYFYKRSRLLTIESNLAVKETTGV